MTEAPPMATSFRAAEVFVLIGAVDVEDALYSPAAGTVSFSAVRFTGAGASAMVRFLFKLVATKTGPPPAPTAVRLGARKGTNLSEFSGPLNTSVKLVSGMLAPDRLLFL